VAYTDPANVNRVFIFALVQIHPVGRDCDIFNRLCRFMLAKSDRDMFRTCAVLVSARKHVPRHLRAHAGLSCRKHTHIGIHGYTINTLVYFTVSSDMDLLAFPSTDEETESDVEILCLCAL
jgi:hypothetical protein